MKKKILFLMTLLEVSLFALAEMRINVYHKDGTKTSFIASEVDSVGFEDYNAEENPTRGYENGHEWVDLSLPSGTKWATI